MVSLMRAGDRRAFEAIYRRYAGPLYRYARKNVTIPEDCEEMVQDIFVSLWVRRQTLLVESLSNYLLRSIRYMIIRYFRHKSAQKRYAEHYRAFVTLYDTGDPDRHKTDDVRARVMKSLEGLPERCRMAMKLRIDENLSNQEIAQRMNISKRTVELYMSRALRHLRVSLPFPCKGT